MAPWQRIPADYLVTSFLAAEDTQAQDRAAYAIQELLKFCGFTPGLPVGRCGMAT